MINQDNIENGIDLNNIDLNNIVPNLEELHYDYKGVYVKSDDSKYNRFHIYLRTGQKAIFYDFNTHKELVIDLGIVNKIGVIEGLPQTEF